MGTITDTLREQNFSDELLEKLHLLLQQKQIHHIWLNRQENCAFSLLTVRCKDRTTADTELTGSFIDTIFNREKILISVLDEQDIKQHYADGNFFFINYAREKDLIYGDPKTGIRYRVFDHDLRRLRKRYLDTENLLTQYAEELSTEPRPGATALYLKNIQRDLGFLEYLRLGISLPHKNMTERMLLLEHFIPELKRFFVKKEGGKEYYLLKSIETEDDASYMEEHQQTVQKIKKQMRTLVLNKMKVFKPTDTPNLAKIKNRLLKDKQVKNALRPILKLESLEELYVFHQMTYVKSDHHCTQYYILALVSPGSETKMEEAIQNVHKISSGDLSFTILCHTRTWIQEMTYESQGFFRSILVRENRIYTSDFHPQIHWDRDHVPYPGELSIYRRKAGSLYKKHLKVADRNRKQETVQMIPHDLNQYFGQLLKNRLYAECGYLPLTNNVQTLWDLFRYVQKSDTGFTHLIKQFPIDLIAYLSEHENEKKPILHMDQTQKNHLFKFLKRLKERQ